MTKDDFSTARHEAAHAVAAWHEGCRLAFVTTNGPRLDCGAYAYARQRYPVADDFLAIDNIQARAVVHFSPAANGAVHPWPDVYDFMRLLTHGTADGREMARTAADLLDQFKDDPETAARAFYEQFNADTLAVVDNEQAQAAIDKLAGLLAEKGRLSGFEVAHFLEKSWRGPRPEKVLPAADHLTSLNTQTATDADNLQSAKRLIRMGFNLIPLNDDTESAREAVLQAIFQLAGVEL